VRLLTAGPYGNETISVMETMDTVLVRAGRDA
jgi:hypothetical protein